MNIISKQKKICTVNFKSKIRYNNNNHKLAYHVNYLRGIILLQIFCTLLVYLKMWIKAYNRSLNLFYVFLFDGWYVLWLLLFCSYNIIIIHWVDREKEFPRTHKCSRALKKNKINNKYPSFKTIKVF